MPMKYSLSKLRGPNGARHEHQFSLLTIIAPSPKGQSARRALYSGPNGYWWMESSSFVGRTMGKNL
jgi:hypothetical protein